MKRILAFLLAASVVPAVVFYLSLRAETTFAEQYPNVVRSHQSEELNYILDAIGPFIDELRYPIEVYSYHTVPGTDSVTLVTTANVTAPKFRDSLNKQYLESTPIASKMAQSQYEWAGIYRVCYIFIGGDYTNFDRKIDLYHELGHCLFESAHLGFFRKQLNNSIFDESILPQESEYETGLHIRESELVAMFTAAIAGYNLHLVKSPFVQLKHNLDVSRSDSTNKVTYGEFNTKNPPMGIYQLLSEAYDPRLIMEYIQQNQALSQLIARGKPIPLFQAIRSFYSSTFFKEHLVTELNQFAKNKKG